MKTFLLTLTAILMASWQVLAQAPAISWQKSLGGTSDDRAYCITATSDGGTISAGFATSTDGDVVGNHGSGDFWIVKLDSDGNASWTKSYGGSDYDQAYSIIQTLDGGYIVAGFTYSNDGNVTGNHGGADWWVVKLNQIGNIMWSKTLGGSGEETAGSIIQLPDGNYIVSGYSKSNDGDVPGNNGGNDAWIVKLSSNGDIIWSKTHGGSGHDYLKTGQQTMDGGYIVSGYKNTGFWVHGQDYWIVKLDSVGNISWEKTLGGSMAESSAYIRQTVDGGYISAGFTWSNNGDVTGYKGGGDYWVVKLNSSGNITWAKTLGGSGLDYAYSILQTSGGEYIVAGYSNSNNGDVSGNHGNYDYWIVKLNDIGNIIWTKTMGGSGEDRAYSMTKTSDCGYALIGYSNSNNGDVQGNHGGHDYWIVKLDSENEPPIAFCKDVIVTANQNCEGFVTAQQVDNGSYDPDGNSFTLSLSPEGVFQLGVTTVTLTITDDCGDSDQCTATVTVIDDTLPVITTQPGEMEFVIWPPNHKYKTFVLTDFVLSVDDNCTSLNINDVDITKATSDEPEDAEGHGDGNTLYDMVIADGCKSIQLRKERQGDGNGRVYTIYLELDDGNGNIGSALCYVQVPHNNGGTAIDDGPVYEVSGNCDNKSSFITRFDNKKVNLNVYPNPFNASTTIAFILPETSNVILKVYNSMGIEIGQLFQGVADANRFYKFPFSGLALPNGIYTIYFQSDENISITKKMLLSK